MPNIIPTQINSEENVNIPSCSIISSKRWLIINDLISTLRNITPNNGYTNKINYVSNDPIEYNEIDNNQIPFIIIDDIENGNEFITPLTNAHLDNDLEFMIKVIYRASIDLTENVDTIIKDIKNALYEDITRNNNAYFTEIEFIDIEKTEKKDVVILNFDIFIEYISDLNNP